MTKARYSKYLKLIILLGDLILFFLSFLISSKIFNLSFLETIPISPLFLYVSFSLLWILIIIINPAFLEERILYREKIILHAFQFIIIHFFGFLLFLMLFYKEYFPVNTYLKTYLVIFILLTVWRFLMVTLIKMYRKQGKNYRKFAIIGYNDASKELKRYLTEDLTKGYYFSGYFDDAPNNIHNPEIKGNINDFFHLAKELKIDEVFCITPAIDNSRIKKITRFTERELIRLKLVPVFNNYIKQTASLSFYGQFPVVQYREEPLEIMPNRILKRSFDIIFSLFVILFLFPILFPLIALAIRLESKGSVFFRQDRNGEMNKIFPCLKFRTMIQNGEAHSKQAIKNDPRITKVGRFLRKTNLDELPQFLNILWGHMSVVGPRPHMLKHTEDYSKIIDQYMVRHFVKPGLTGLAQVNGLRGETNDHHQMQKRVEYDVWYIENWSFFLDIKIIIRTIINMIKGDQKAF